MAMGVGETKRSPTVKKKSGTMCRLLGGLDVCLRLPRLLTFNFPVGVVSPNTNKPSVLLLLTAHALCNLQQRESLVRLFIN